MDRIALTLVIIGALNWLMVGLFNYDLIAGIFGSQTAFVARAVYTVIGLAGIWSLSLLFRKTEARA